MTQSDTETTTEEQDVRYGYSTLTNTWYRVNEWDDLGDGKIRAKSKEEVDENEVPKKWLEALAPEEA